MGDDEVLTFKQQFITLIRDWRVLEDEVKVLNSEAKEKNKRIKAIKKMVADMMKDKKVGVVNTPAGVAARREKTSKSSITTKYLLSTLTLFFKGNQEMAKQCVAFLDEKRPVRNTETLTLEPTGDAGSTMS
jgi:hypothetical protein